MFFNGYEQKTHALVATIMQVPLYKQLFAECNSRQKAMKEYLPIIARTCADLTRLSVEEQFPLVVDWLKTLKKCKDGVRPTQADEMQKKLRDACVHPGLHVFARTFDEPAFGRDPGELGERASGQVVGRGARVLGCHHRWGCHEEGQRGNGPDGPEITEHCI